MNILLSESVQVAAVPFRKRIEKFEFYDTFVLCVSRDSGIVYI